MDLMQLRTVQWLTVVGAVASSIGLLAIWESPYRIPAIVIVCAVSAILLIAELQRDRISVLFSGIKHFHRSFPVHRNQVVLRSVRSEYRYLGVSFASVLTDFRVWFERERPAKAKVKLLLSDPDLPDVLAFQARFERGLLKPDLSETEEKEIVETVTRVRHSIRLTLETIRSMEGGAGAIEVRLHKERLRHWAALVDDGHAVVGLLRRGETGLRCPVVELARRYGKWGLYDHYAEEWDAMWESAKRVDWAAAVIAGV
jgi:hypothetical protein